MKDELFFAFLALLLAVPVNCIVDIVAILVFYHLHPENEWYSENYHRLPKFFRIFDKH